MVPGIGRTGVVGVIRGRKGKSDKVIGLRADMDALPIEEATGLPYTSTVPGKMHACGHDGHTAMLLGAARYLAETRNFAGTAVVIFQPAEEGGAGAKAMINDGMMERFGIDEVYGMHNYPGMPVGSFGSRPGPIMAAADHFTIDIEGVGGHAARPHKSDRHRAGRRADHQQSAIDRVAQRRSARSRRWFRSACSRPATTDNVIPQTAQLRGTARSLVPYVQDLIEKRMHEVVEGTAELYGAKAKLNYRRGYPVLENHASANRLRGFGGAAKSPAPIKSTPSLPPVMGAEDFSFMLNARPGAFIFIGNGDSAGLHHPAYNFNDDVIPFGTSYWVKLVETALPG